MVVCYQDNPDDTMARLKERLVVKGHAQIYEIDYLDTFSPITKLTFIKLFLSLALLTNGICTKSILRMFFFIVIFRKKYILSNHLGLLVTGRVLRYITFENLCMK